MSVRDNKSFFKTISFTSKTFHIYIPLHSCDYLKKISIKIKVATDEGNSLNEIGHWTNDEIENFEPSK